MKKFFVAASALLMLTASQPDAQKLITRDAYVKFFSSTPIENIEAVTNQASSILEMSSGEVAFRIPMKSFQFEKALMQEHFNENYVESDKFPNGALKGKIDKWEQFIKTAANTDFETTVTGTMTIHGVDKAITEPIKLRKTEAGIVLESVFKLRPEDYGVKIPGTVRKNIAETMEVTVKCNYPTK